MSVTEQLTDAASRVDGLRDNLERVRAVLDQTDAVLSSADGLLERTDDVLGQAAEVMEKSRRWAPRLALVVGLVAVAGIATIVVLRMRQSADDD